MLIRILIFFVNGISSFVGLFNANVRGAYDKFPDFFVWALLLIIHT